MNNRRNVEEGGDLNMCACSPGRWDSRCTTSTATSRTVMNHMQSGRSLKSAGGLPDSE